MAAFIYRVTSKLDSRILAMIVLAAAMLRIMPASLALEQFYDETVYAFRGKYYLNRLIHLDFSGSGSDPLIDPGFDPLVYHSFDHPFGSNFYYAMVFLLTGAQTPALPTERSEEMIIGPETPIPEAALLVLRTSAVLAGSVGLALIALRFGLRGAAACLLFLAVPHVANDLAYAYAEGPLLLGFGLCAVSYGTRWFPAAAAAAGAFKLNSILTWPLLLIPSSGGRFKPGQERRKVFTNLLTTALCWALFTPQSWRAGGPPYLLLMIAARLGIYEHQVVENAGFFPTRYLWPFELAALLILTHLPQVLAWLKSVRRRAPAEQLTEPVGRAAIL